MEDVVDSFRLDHLGLPAQMADEIGLVDALDALLGVDAREVVTSKHYRDIREWLKPSRQTL